jgi:hypothetical protein
MLHLPLFLMPNGFYAECNVKSIKYEQSLDHDLYENRHSGED